MGRSLADRMTVAIGVDIGGSAIKFAVVDQAGSIVWPPGG